MVFFFFCVLSRSRCRRSPEQRLSSRRVLRRPLLSTRRRLRYTENNPEHRIIETATTTPIVLSNQPILIDRCDTPPATSSHILANPTVNKESRATTNPAVSILRIIMNPITPPPPYVVPGIEHRRHTGPAEKQECYRGCHHQP